MWITRASDDGGRYFKSRWFYLNRQTAQTFVIYVGNLGLSFLLDNDTVFETQNITLRAQETLTKMKNSFLDILKKDEVESAPVKDHLFMMSTKNGQFFDLPPHTIRKNEK